MIRLRKIEPSDLAFLYRWENDERSWADGAVHNPLSHRDLAEYIGQTSGDFFRDGQLRLIIEEDGVMAGCADLTDHDARNRKAAVGLYVAPEFRGRHIAEEAMAQLERLAFEHLGLRMIYAVINTNNRPCSRLFERMGYEAGAVLRAWTLESDARVWQRVSEAPQR